MKYQRRPWDCLFALTFRLKSPSLSVFSASASFVSWNKREYYIAVQSSSTPYYKNFYGTNRFLSITRTCTDEDSSLEKENWLSESLISSTLALNMPLLLFFLQTGLKQCEYLNINVHSYCIIYMYYIHNDKRDNANLNRD